MDGLHFSANILNSAGNLITSHSTDVIGKYFNNEDLGNKNYLTLNIKRFDFKEGEYFINLDCVYQNEWIDRLEYAGEISVVSSLPYNYVKPMKNGLVAIEADWILV